MPAAREAYETRRREALADDARLDPYSAVAGNSRVVLVAVALVLVALYRFSEGVRPAYAAIGAVFVTLLIFQLIIDARRRLAQRRAAHHARNLDRLDGKWTTFESTGDKLADLTHAYARDLDVVGKGSLFQLLDTTRTAQGESTLARWLLAPSPLAELDERRTSVRDFAPRHVDREKLALAGLDDDAARVNETPLVAFAEGPALFTPPAWLAPVTWVLPTIVFGILIASRFDVISWRFAIPFVLLELLVLRLHRDDVRRIASVAAHAEDQLSRLLPILATARTLPGTTPQLAHLQAALEGAVEGTRSLKRRVTFFQSRANLILAFLGPLMLWDLHAARMLENWRKTRGPALRKWFEALGEIEALASLSAYAFEHPDDVWPELVPGPLAFAGTSVGHPLLPTDRCIRNDVTLGGPGTALLVTGSNMSGKSTLLRATGLAAVMALAGLPVRAKTLRISLLQVATAMRVSDSLQEGASFFLAEVKRLKTVVDLAHTPVPVLFLLDEILQGTNTRERSLGARGVIRHLTEAGAMGLVSTHDLSLAELGTTLGGRLTYAHFTDQVTGDQMTFDYLMRPGIVQTTNALRLMRAMGLEVDVPDAA